MLEMQVRGRFLLLFVGMMSLVVTCGLAMAFRYSTRHRFAMGVYALEETPEKKPAVRMGFVSVPSNQTLPWDQPLVARVERGTAGSRSLQAVAYVVGTNGHILYRSGLLKPKSIRERSWFGWEKIVTVEETLIPPLQELPFSQEYQVVIVRLPEISLQDRLLQETAGESSLEVRVARMRLLAERRWNGRVENQKLFIRKSTNRP